MNQEVTSSIHDEIETIREVRELLKLLSQARIPELVKGIAKGDLIILKKDKAMCPYADTNLKAHSQKTNLNFARRHGSKIELPLETKDLLLTTQLYDSCLFKRIETMNRAWS